MSRARTSEVVECDRVRALLRKVFEEGGHSDLCRWRKTYPVGPENDLCDCYRAELARELGVWEPRST
jgi:hypothetical protein